MICPECGATKIDGECLPCALGLAIAAPQPSSDAGLPTSIGEYRVLGVLGEGGMGLVYEAEQEHPYRHVAVKVLKPSALGEHTNRFIAEYEVLAYLDHPAIAKIYEAGAETVTYRNGAKAVLPFFAMELVDGLSLTEYCTANALGHKERLQLVMKLVEAVHYAHQRGVIHRDLKPTNVVVGSDGQPKVLDFGVARATVLGHAPTLATRAGQIFGTIPYMSPEQLRGDPGSIDIRTDIFSLGVTLYQVLTGELPFAGDVPSVEAIAQRLNAVRYEPASRYAPECQGDIDAIIDCCLEPDKEDRYDSAADLLADLERHLAGDVVLVRQASRWYVARRRLKRYRRQVVQATVVLLAILVFAAVGWHLFLSASRANAAARDKLFESRVSQAQMAIASNRIDRRSAALEAVEAAATIRPAPELADLAIAAMATDGFDLMASIPGVTQVWAQEHNTGSTIPVGRGNDLYLVDSRTGEPRAVLEGPDTADFRLVQYNLSLDGRFLVASFVVHPSASRKYVWVWQVDPPRKLFELESDVSSPIVWRESLVVALDGVQLYDAFTGSLQASFAEGRAVRTHKLHPNKPWVALVLNDRVEVWDLETHELVQTVSMGRVEDIYHRPWTNFYGAAWDRSGQRLAISTGTGHLHVWDMKENVLIQTLSKHDELVFAVMFGPGELLLSSGWDRTTRIWDLGSGAQAFRSFGQSTRIVAASDRWIALEEQGSVNVYRYAGSEERELHYSGNALNDIRFSPSGGWLATAGNVAVELRNMKTDRRVVLLDGTAKFVRFSPDGTMLYAGTRSGLYCWSVEMTPRLLWHRPESVQGLDVTPDGRSLYVVFGPVLEGRKGHYELVTEWRGILSAETGDLEERMAWTNGVLKPVVSSDGRFVAFSSRRGSSEVLERDTGRQVRMTPYANIIEVAFSPDSRYFVQAGQDDTRVFDTSRWEELRRFESSWGTPLLAFSPDGVHLAEIGGFDSILLYDIESGERVAALPLDGTDARAVTFSPDGTRLLVGSMNGKLFTWHLDRVDAHLRALGLPSRFGK